MCRLLLVVCASSLLPLTACGGGGGANPVKSTPTPVSATITPGDDVILLGESVQFSASVSFSDGSSSQPRLVPGEVMPRLSRPLTRLEK